MRFKKIIIAAAVLAVLFSALSIYVLVMFRQIKAPVNQTALGPIYSSVFLSASRVLSYNDSHDLMTYALLGPVPHAPIDPFQTIADGYRQTSRSGDWGRVFFDDPSHYLHLDAEGRIALSRRDLKAGNFVADDLSKLDSPEVERAVEERTEAWRNLFAEDHFCARCKAWRICRARLRDGKAAPDGCDAFFREMEEVIERRRNKPGSNRSAEKWQP